MIVVEEEEEDWIPVFELDSIPPLIMNPASAIAPIMPAAMYMLQSDTWSCCVPFLIAAEYCLFSSVL